MATRRTCTCGCTPPHSNSAHCRANHHATNVMMSRRPVELPTIRTETGQFVRFPVAGEWDLPAGTVLADGVMAR